MDMSAGIVDSLINSLHTLSLLWDTKKKKLLLIKTIWNTLWNISEKKHEEWQANMEYIYEVIKVNLI